MATALRSATSLLAGIAIFMGLPLIGWGVMDVRGFLGHPARLAYVVAAILLQVFVAFKFSGASRKRGDGTKKAHANHGARRTHYDTTWQSDSDVYV